MADWKNTVERIREADENGLVHWLQVMQGEGDYDAVAFICCNRRSESFNFLNTLALTGLIEKSHSREIGKEPGFYKPARILKTEDFEEFCKNMNSRCTSALKPKVIRLKEKETTAQSKEV